MVFIFNRIQNKYNKHFHLDYNESRRLLEFYEEHTSSESAEIAIQEQDYLRLHPLEKINFFDKVPDYNKSFAGVYQLLEHLLFSVILMFLLQLFLEKRNEEPTKLPESEIPNPKSGILYIYLKYLVI